MNVRPGSISLRPVLPEAQARTAPRPTAERAPPAKEPPRQDKVATAYRIERPMPQPRPNAPRGSTVNLLV
jgi:hypothetical protein